MDSFMTRPVSLAAPSSGVALARFRTRTSDAARRFADMLGYSGVQGREALMYPWTSSMGNARYDVTIWLDSFIGFVTDYNMKL